MLRKSDIERFMGKVSFSDNGCWLWHGAIKPGGYGAFMTGRKPFKKSNNAHRWIYEFLNGPIRDGLVIDHLCRTRNCVNPKHMEPTTMRENLMRGFSPTSLNAKKQVCPNGHPLMPVPASYNTSAKRYCPICEKTNAKKWNMEHRERKNENNRKSRSRHRDSINQAKREKYLHKSPPKGRRKGGEDASQVVPLS